MGLNMYLEAKTYINNYNENEKEKNNKINELFFIKNKKYPTEISFTVADWRKVYSIHTWFIKNCQKNENYISRESLQKLVELCKKSLKDIKFTQKYLPINSEFDDNEETSKEDLEYTIKTIESLLQNDELKNFDFHYNSSW